jgi:hypothetical protein
LRQGAFVKQSTNKQAGKRLIFYNRNENKV